MIFHSGVLCIILYSFNIDFYLIVTRFSVSASENSNGLNIHYYPLNPVSSSLMGLYYIFGTISIERMEKDDNQ